MTIDSVLNEPEKVEPKEIQESELQEPEKIAPKEPEFATKQPLKTV